MAKYTIIVDDDNLKNVYIMKNDMTGLAKIKVYKIDGEAEGSKQDIPKRWRAEKWSVYYFINHDGGIVYEIDTRSEIDNIHFGLGNYFATREEAEFYVKKLRVYNELRAFAEPDDEQVWDGRQKHVYITYNPGSHLVYYISCFYMNECHGLSFATKEIAEAAIVAVGIERVKKYYFGVMDG